MAPVELRSCPRVATATGGGAMILIGLGVLFGLGANLILAALLVRLPT